MGVQTPRLCTTGVHTKEFTLTMLIHTHCMICCKLEQMTERPEDLSVFLCGDLCMVTEEWIRELIEKDELWKFYKSKDWIRLKTSVLKAAHYECAECRKQGKITRYDIGNDGKKRLLSTVHHVCHVRDHPELALSRTYKDYSTGNDEKNLIPVCKACHNKLHPEKYRHNMRKAEGYTNVERW